MTTTRWVEEEVVRKIPVKSYRMEYEERVEEYPVQVRRTVPVKKMVERKRTVGRYVPYQTERTVAKTVVEKVPISDAYCVPGCYSSSSYGAPSSGYSNPGWHKLDAADVDPSLRETQKPADPSSSGIVTKPLFDDA